jgi:hypothetical protein
MSTIKTHDLCSPDCTMATCISGLLDEDITKHLCVIQCHRSKGVNLLTKRLFERNKAVVTIGVIWMALCQAIIFST